MSRLFYALTLVFLLITYVIAVPISAGGQRKVNQAIKNFKKPITPIHRVGAKNNVVGGGIRDKDFNIKGGMVHKSDTKGLSFNTKKPDASRLAKNQAVHSIKPSQLKGSEFHAVHDGGKNGHAPGHVSLAYKGANPISPADMKKKLNDLPWTKEHGTKK